MKMKRIYTFTDEELQELVNKSTSRVFIKKSVLHISLHAYHFADLKQSLCEIFDESINHFKPELGGIVLSYRNIKVLNSIGKIINDDSRVYIDVQADYYVFSPEVGCVLTGIVNKKSNNHVGCLVHNLFNVSIPRPEEGPWDGETMEIGQKITFKVEFVDFDLNLPYIRGKLVDSSSHLELTEEHIKKKKKKKNKDKFKDEDILDNQLAEVHGDNKQEDTPEPKVIKKEKKKDKKSKKRAEDLNQNEQLLSSNAQVSGESEHLYQPLDRLDGKSSGQALEESMDWNTSRDFSDISVLACSTQNEEMPPKQKKKKKKSKDLEENSITVDNSEELQELTNSSPKEELSDIPKKKKKKLFMNNLDTLIVTNEDADHAVEDLAVKRKLKKHKKHKLHDADTGTEMPMQNIKPEITTKAITNALSGTTNIKSGKTKKQGNSDIDGTNSDVGVEVSNEDEHREAATSNKKSKQTSSAILQSPAAKAGKNLNTTVDSVTDSNNLGKEASKRKAPETKLDAISSPKKKKRIRFSTEIEVKCAQEDVQTDSEKSDIEEKKSNSKEAHSDTDESSSFISGASVASPFGSSIYSGANMVNSMDRKRKKVVKVHEDVTTLKRPINSISPSLISSTRALLQNLPEPKIKDPTALSLSSPSDPEERKEVSFRGLCSPQGKSGSEQSNPSSSPSKPLTPPSKPLTPPSKPLTQKEGASSQSKTDANVSEATEALEPLDISYLIARLSSSENTVVQKQEQASKSPKADKEKKSKKKKQSETDSKGDSQPANNTKDTGKKSDEDVSAGIITKINTAELPSIAELFARVNSVKSGAPKQEESPKSPKADKDKKSKTKKKDVKEASTKSKHKEHKKDKKNKDEKKEDKSKKKKDKIKIEHKTSKEKKTTEKESDLTDLSRKLLHDFLKKQNSN